MAGSERQRNSGFVSKVGCQGYQTMGISVSTHSDQPIPDSTKGINLLGRHLFGDQQQVAEGLADEHAANHHSRETAQPDQEPCHDSAVMVGSTALCTRAGEHCNGLD